MADITIHRCTLRIVRHGGWCWGPEPQKLLHGALKALPQLLALELGKYWTDDFDDEIATPIKINVPIRLEELVAVSNETLNEGRFEYSTEFSLLGQKINSAVHAALVKQQSPPASTPNSQSRQDLDRETEPPRADNRSILVEVLRSWQKESVLVLRLAAFSAASLEAWYATIVRTIDHYDLPSESDTKTVARLVEEISCVFPTVTETRAAILRRRLIVLTEVMTRLNVSVCSRALLLELERILPIRVGKQIEEGEERITTNGSTDVTPDSQISQAEISLSKGIFESETSARSSFELSHSGSNETDNTAGESFSTMTSGAARTRLEAPATKLTLRRLAYQAHNDASALPFLMLGPLSRLGYLKTLTAVLAASNSTDAAPIFATALAYKVSAPPARGWRRDEKAIATASLFAGLEQPAEGTLLAELARILSTQLSPLEATLSGALIAGHNQDQPLLLLRTKGDGLSGFLLLDVEGLFPIQWAKDIVALRSTLIQLDSSVVLIPGDHAETTLLRWMDEQGFRFVTDALPARSEHWRALRRPPLGRWWTNDGFTSESLLVEAAQCIPVALEDALALWQMVAIERPAMPLARDSEMERHLTMTTGVGLGTIAWELWRERGTTAPHLALERFRDLDARVRYSRDTIHVSLPLGRRFQDLVDNHFLDDVNDAPWFSGRTLTFGLG